MFLPEYGVRGLGFRPSNSTFASKELAVSMILLRQHKILLRLSPQVLPSTPYKQLLDPLELAGTTLEFWISPRAVEW